MWFLKYVSDDFVYRPPGGYNRDTLETLESMIIHEGKANIGLCLHYKSPLYRNSVATFNLVFLWND